MTGREAAAHRIHAGLTNKALAKLWGKGAGTISRLEHLPEVPADYAARYLALEPGRLPGTKGPYRRGLTLPAKVPELANVPRPSESLPWPPAEASAGPRKLPVKLPAPLFDERGVRLYLADARELLPRLEAEPGRTVVITDPIWPDAPVGMFPGVHGPAAARTLLAEIAACWPRLARRALVHLGDGSDPRILTAIPPELPFYRACWLRYPRGLPRAGRLQLADVVHVFGRPDRGKMPPGETLLRGHRPWAGLHPCPRDPEGVAWLIQHYTAPGDLVIDPCAGSGTTLVEAMRLGRRALGCEPMLHWAMEAAERLRQEAAAGELWPPGTFEGPRKLHLVRAEQTPLEQERSGRRQR